MTCNGQIPFQQRMMVPYVKRVWGQRKMCFNNEKNGSPTQSVCQKGKKQMAHRRGAFCQQGERQMVHRRSVVCQKEERLTDAELCAKIKRDNVTRC